MSAQSEIAILQGWTPETELELLWSFLAENPKLFDEAMAFLAKIAHEENEEIG